MSLPRRSVTRPVGVSMVAAAVALLGLISFGRLPIELLPDVAYPKLLVHTGYPGAGPAEVERFVTAPLEQQLAGLPAVRDVESVSREGISLVTIWFAWGTDMDVAVLNVRERIQAVGEALPERADRPIVLRTDPGSDPVMALSVSGAGDLLALRELAETVLRRRLEQVDGVARAAVTGGLHREVQVEVDSRRAESFGIGLDHISEALAASSQALPGGTVTRGRLNYHLRTMGELEAASQIGDVVVARASPAEGGDRGEVRVRDLATIRDGFAEPTSIARYNGEDAVGLLLYREPDASAVAVAREVGRVVARLRAEHPDIHLRLATSQAGFIADAVSSVTQALLLGGILAFLVLFLFLRDARYPVAVGLAIPLSVLAALALLDLAGVSLNIMSLGGLALGVGMLVDNSIVVLENISRHHELQTSGLESPTPGSAVVGAEEVQGAITASTLTTVAVFGPIAYVKGVAGQLFTALSLAVTFSLLASLLVALTVLPTLAARWQSGGWLHRGKHPLPERRGPPRSGAGLAAAVSRRLQSLFAGFDRGFSRFAECYHRLLVSSLRHRGRVVAITGVLFLAAMGLASVLPRSVLPPVDQGGFRVRLALAEGASLDRTAEATAKLDSVLRETPGVEATFTLVGRGPAVAGLGGWESGVNTAAIDVRLSRGAATATTLARLRPTLQQWPAGVPSVEAGQAAAVGWLTGEGVADLAVRVRGDDPAGVLRYARVLARALASAPALANVRLGLNLGQPEARVEINRERVAAFGLDARTVAEAVERYMLGHQATDLLEFDRRTPVVVRLPESQRHSLGTLRDLTVEGVPLRELIRVKDEAGPTEIRRRRQTRVVPIYADVAGSGLSSAVAAIRLAIASAAPVPRGVRVEIGGENEEMRESFRDLGFAFGLALLLVYMILAAQLESFLHPLTILLSVPLALIGAVGALALTGAGLNAMSLIGMVILVGIAVNDAIIKVEFINRSRARGASVRDAILEAGRARLRPILMTTVTTVLGLLPMALGLGRGADLRAPLAIAVIGGLVTATALTLVVIPVAYDLVAGLRGRRRAEVA